MPETGVLEPLRRITRNTMLVTIVMVGVMPVALMIPNAREPWGFGLLAVGTTAFVALSAVRTVRLIRGPWHPVPLRQTVAMLAFAVVLAVVAGVVHPAGAALCGLLVGLGAAEFTVARDLRASWRYTAIAMLVYALVLAGQLVLFGQGVEALRTVGVAVLVVVCTVYAAGASFRQWEGALKLEEARRDAAELAATRERLRLAEDLHDILGHALEVVSLKSELATRLGPVDPERSQAEMVEVQRLARGALRDVRALAKGRRPTDFATELAGARTLLDSAGVRCDFDADPALLTAAERDVFGRVLREAVTNLLRHSAARTCRVTLAADHTGAVLRVRNDGVEPLPADPEGSGLHSLARRVGETGGTFTAGAADGGCFEVVTTVPRGDTP